MPAPLLLRADASAVIGTGHVMRCLALAQAWQRSGGRVIFAHAETTPALERRLRADGSECVRGTAVRGSADDAAWTLALARTHGAEWVVADGYVFDAAWQNQLRAAGQRLLLIDDYGQAEHYCADLVLNQNAGADVRLYAQREASTRLLLGTRYALLRQEFRRAHVERPAPLEFATKVLVTMGGGDPDNVTGWVLEAMVGFEGLEFTVVVGGSNPHRAEIEAAAGRLRSPARVIVDAANMPELMAAADLAISAAGSTTWELAHLGVPAVLIVVADNQAGIAAMLQREGVSVSLGDFRQLTAQNLRATVESLGRDRARRQEMSVRARCLVDGEGATRVVVCLQAAALKLRRVDQRDCDLLWDWANDPGVRASAFSSAPISWEVHCRWFDAKLRDASSLLLIGFSAEGDPVGQVRFDGMGDDAVEIDVSVDRRQRHSGIGPVLIRCAADFFFAEKRGMRLQALVKMDNLPSVRAFEKAGFIRAGAISVRGHETLRLQAFSHD